MLDHGAWTMCPPVSAAAALIARTEEGNAASAGVLRHAGFPDDGVADGLHNFSLDRPSQLDQRRQAAVARRAAPGRRRAAAPLDSKNGSIRQRGASQPRRARLVATGRPSVWPPSVPPAAAPEKTSCAPGTAYACCSGRHSYSAGAVWRCVD